VAILTAIFFYLEALCLQQMSGADTESACYRLFSIAIFNPTHPMDKQRQDHLAGKARESKPVLLLKMGSMPREVGIGLGSTARCME